MEPISTSPKKPWITEYCLMRKKELQRERDSLVNYLRHKIDVGDWHAVSDASNDIRECEAALTTVTSILNEGALVE